MRVVSNTSPLSNLAVIDRLDLLKERYGRVLVPNEVWNELSEIGHVQALGRLKLAAAETWLVVDSSSPRPSLLGTRLDAGETAAISLAVSINADVLLIDEMKGRAAARACGLRVAGVLGELLHARLHGRLPSLGIEIERLRNEAGFYIGSDIEKFFLSEAGE